ncbi:MAG: kinase/pyrophosphorylase, partial [Pseudomonadota bacterium]
MTETPPPPLHVHVVSDSTGGTAASAVQAVAALFDAPWEEVPHVFARTPEKIEEALRAAAASPGPALIVYTLTDVERRDQLVAGAERMGIPTVALLSPLIGAFRVLLGQDPARQPGQQYRVNEAYLDKIAALDFAMSHDDGQGLDRLLAADVILVGVSRTSKTPTCVYLAYQGVRAANVPLVPGQAPPQSLLDALAAGIPAIGLIATPSRLAQVRATRLDALERGDTPA